MVHNRPSGYFNRSSDQPSSSKSNGKCKVCEYSPASPHFGVTTCRPCAAFFRRSVVTKRKYHCNEEEKCIIHYEARPLCAYCRYQKTLAVGMTVNNIRLNSDKTGPIRQPSQVPSHIDPSSSSLLGRMSQGYKMFLSRTRELYFVINPLAIFNDEIEYKRATLPEHLIYDRSQLHLMYKMLENHFHPFETLEKADMMKVFEHFQPYFTRLNMFYLSLVEFPQFPKRLLMFYGGYVDESEPLSLFSEDKNPEDSCKHFHMVLRKFFKINLKLRNLNVDRTEVAAIAGIILWNEANRYLNTDRFNPHIDQITFELIDYCKTKSQPSQTRSSLLLCCCRDLDELIFLVKASTVVGQIINDYKVPIMHQDIYKVYESPVT